MMIEIDEREMDVVLGGNACSDFFGGLAVGLGIGAAIGAAMGGVGGVVLGAGALGAKAVEAMAC
jgi:hypothetical protein